MITVRVVEVGSFVDINGVRFPTYNGYALKVFNEQMFETISFKDSGIFVPKHYLNHFSGLTNEDVITVMEVSFNRPPSNDPSNQGRFTSVYEILTIDEYERIVDLFNVSQNFEEKEE